jgi:hypothetical protein
MEYFIGARRSGKTRELVNWVLEDPEHRRLIVPTWIEAERIAREYTLEHRQDKPWEGTVLCLEEANRLRGTSMLGKERNKFEFAVDNIDLVVKMFLSSLNITTMSGTGIITRLEVKK